MRIDVLTLFPEFFEGPLQMSLLGKAIASGALEVACTDIRAFTTDKHRSADDAPYGGGPGMVMKAEPVWAAAESLRGKNSLERVILLSPRGRQLTQRVLLELSQTADFVLICGRYEGVDERVEKGLCTDSISVGDYVLSGGEAPALTIIEGVSRLLPGVVGDFGSIETDSFFDGLLSYPQYTRPPELKGMRVPDVLLNGNHAAIARWRRKEAIRITRERRPDLLTNLSESDRILLNELENEGEIGDER